MTKHPTDRDLRERRDDAHCVGKMELYERACAALTLAVGDPERARVHAEIKASVRTSTLM